MPIPTEYVYTITVGDGTNNANAVTYTITVTDVGWTYQQHLQLLMKQQLMVLQ